VVSNAKQLGQFERLDIPAFPGGRSFRAPLLFLALTWFSLRDKL
jgi:gamma-glutamylputrescine oxidase